MSAWQLYGAAYRAQHYKILLSSLGDITVRDHVKQHDIIWSIKLLFSSILNMSDLIARWDRQFYETSLYSARLHCWIFETVSVNAGFESLLELCVPGTFQTLCALRWKQMKLAMFYEFNNWRIFCNMYRISRYLWNYLPIMKFSILKYRSLERSIKEHSSLTCLD